ncbi:PAS domain S-box protein [Massilia forsythiae]|uniref:histidine kinase n=1 Tax=Massilia forsythiae TaxID=2728020 RepID=A0A7Z2VZB3_9BURK|nr:ATP-binding protein [Massilia forsythiae]QJE01640.1 PAS domain S-box protein [Massilia forsythiae]
MHDRFTPEALPPRLADRIFRGDGELAALCRSKAWDQTPLGALDAWPASLRTVASIVVASPLPMIVLWGPDLIQIYNDGYRQVMGAKHPAGLGQATRACWPEVWEFNAPLYEGVLERGESFSFEDQLLVLERHGHPENVFFTLGFSPVLDEEGRIGGVLVTVAETTAQVERAEAGKVRADSEERLRLAVEAADLGTWDLDLATDSAPVRSLRHDRIFGYDRLQPEWGLEIALRHVLPEDRATFRDAFARAARTGVVSCEVRVRWPDGSVHWIAPLGRTYYDETGRAVRMTGVVADVTERNRAEALRQSEERFRLMADAVPQIVWITDADGRIEFFNQHWSDYTGLAYDMETAADVAAAVVHPDDAALTMERFAHAQRSGDTFLIEHRIRSASGAYRWFLVRAEPYRDPHDGRILRWFGASVDIHDRKQAEQALHLLAGRQTFRLELADRIRALSDPQQVTAAASALLGDYLGARRVSYAEVDAAGDALVLAPGWSDDAAAPLRQRRFVLDDFGAPVAAALRAGRVLAIDDVAGDGHAAACRDFYLSLGVRSVLAVPLTRNGRLQAVLSVHHANPHSWTAEETAAARDMADRTWLAIDGARAQAELRAEREKLKEADRRKDEFLAMLAHELRNPLAPIGAAAELLQMMRLDEARVRQTSQIIGRQVKHMTHLIDDLLDVSRVTRGLVELDSAPLDVRRIVSDAVEQVGPLIAARRHRLLLELPPDAALVLGDEKRLVQVVANIVNNAAKYTHDEGEIRVTVQADAAQVAIAVADNGIGMTAELCARAFDLFAQAERSSDRSSGGLGLGLALVKSLVELHQGSVTSASGGPGQGSTFTVRLPRLAAQAGQGAAAADGAAAHGTGGGLRIMVVDDNVDAAEMLGMLLEAAGHRVVVEHGSRQALARARGEAPQVCLLDIGLPDMDGNELARRLRADPRTAGAVLIAVTGYGQAHDREATLAAGFDHHLVKPVDSARLAAILGAVERS